MTDETSGRLIGGRYRLISPIATGGMGTVWEGWDERLQRRVAVKQLHPPPGTSEEAARVASERALREARNAARLHHPNAVPVYDVVEEDGRPAVVMQYLPAPSLQRVLTDHGPLGVDHVARIGAELASALAAAHDVGIVHRDVKPANVLVDADGSAKLTDFGISHASGDPSLTSTGLVTGTPAYLAPEVARGAPATPASDVFSLGSTLYTALEGVSPFGDGQNAMATLHRAASGEIDPPRRSGALTPVLTDMLAADPAARPAMAQVAEHLGSIRRFADGPTQRVVPPPPPVPPPPSSTVVLPRLGPPAPPPSRSRAGLVGALVVAALIIAGVVILLTQLGNDGSPSASGNSSTGRSSTTSTHRASSSARRSSKASSSKAPSSTARSTSSSASSSASSPSNPAPPGPGSADPAAAVQRYYGLLPNDTDTAWNLLTPHFQESTAGGRDSYDAYWGSVQSVSTSNVQATGKEDAEATISYVYKDGHKVSERTAFHFKKDHGDLKIDRTESVG